MPSAFKLEKQTSTDAPDTVKQILTVVEKKVRNLEKRKGKLDTYKSDHKNGKELNEDQKNAIKKYDLVVELLEFAKELQKSFNGVVHECVKLQKKAAKREQAERQQQEIQRIKELLLLQDILVNMGTAEIRNDFLLGTNGALLLEEDKLSQLDEFYKLISPDRNSEEEETSFEEQLLAAAEHLTSLLDGKNKEVLNTTYKNLKELLIKINECGYFSPISKSGTANSTEENKETEQEFNDNPQENSELVMPGVSMEVSEEHTDAIGLSSSTSHLDSPYYTSVQYTGQNQPLQEVLPVQGNFNFLQESQIDLQSLHMDPAVVVAHPMIPSTTMGYPTQYHGSNLPSQNIQASQPDGGIVRPSVATSAVSSQVQVAGTNTVNASQLQQNPMNPPQDFDPSCPIPTQTFTNQNFSAVHPIVPVSVPGNYVPAAMTHPSLQQMVPVGMVPQHVSRTPSPPTSATDSHPMTMAPQDSILTTPNVNLGTSSDNKEFDSEYQLQQGSIDNGSGASHFGSSDYQQLEDSQSFSNSQTQNFAQNRGYNAGRGNRGNRGRGSTNGYARGSNSSTTASTGRSNYGNGRSGYQSSGNYYQGSYGGRDNFNNNTNYSNAFKQRGSARGSGGIPRGTNPGTRGGNNGRGYRSQ
ncbi:caprin-1-like isoform X1 [Centruroides sculpturatus]|uniref:caprin-1-like isoform X1 n=1 Tax=Centruroides sculpturatus TaxID=218467 RepID=UPI000C6CAAE8|nr:caprin-1-like isoform X1 [Centruroides sculpturatus]